MTLTEPGPAQGETVLSAKETPCLEGHPRQLHPSIPRKTVLEYCSMNARIDWNLIQVTATVHHGIHFHPGETVDPTILHHHQI